MKSAALAAALPIAALASQPVLAQSATADDETVEARAVIVAPELVLAIAALSNLEFGVVNLPNGTNPGASCRYDLVVQNTTGRIDVAEIKGGNVVDNTVPTGSGCMADSASFMPAGFVVACTAAAPVRFSVTWAGGGRSGVRLMPGVTGVVTNLNSSSVRSVVNPSVQTQFTCPDGASATTSPAGGFVLRVGARLELDDTATPFAGQIGSVTLNATY